jgi:apolipoprotein N-acyltransferase
MHVYGQMPAWMAALATGAFAAFLAIYPALALGLAHALVPSRSARLALALPASWAGAEWLRGTLLTGFPWVAGGYAHTDGPLAGFAPLLGVYGIGLVAGLLAGGLALFSSPQRERGRLTYAWVASVLISALLGGTLLDQQRWTQPAGPPIRVKLVQANQPQDMKFSAPGLARAFDDHWRLMQGERADLVALPESVFPLPLQMVPSEFLAAFRTYVNERNSALVFGVFIEEPAGKYFNSAVAMVPKREDGPWPRYSKRQLVPFGEFIPSGFRWFVDLMQMPIGDQQRGAAIQAPLELAGQRVAINICYEDLFGHVIRAAWSDPSRQPTMMLNLSNLAWFQDSIALPQHLQISRMRALETQHPMLRATNTGATAIIDAHGRVIAQLPFNTAVALDGEVQGYSGETPFLRWGNGPALVLIVALLLTAVILGRSGNRRRPQ